MSDRSPITATVPCRHCDAQISAIAEICPVCGVRQFDRATSLTSERRIATAGLLCFFFGVFGVHRFYAGKIRSGVLQLLTLGGLGIWALVDFILIVTGQFKDAEGRRLTEWT